MKYINRINNEKWEIEQYQFWFFDNYDGKFVAFKKMLKHNVKSGNHVGKFYYVLSTHIKDREISQYYSYLLGCLLREFT